METAHTLKVARTIAGWSQHMLSQAAEVTPTTLSFIENGIVQPQAETRKKIETALGCRIDWRQTFDSGRINHTPQQRNGKSQITKYKEE